MILSGWVRRMGALVVGLDADFVAYFLGCVVWVFAATGDAVVWWASCWVSANGRGCSRRTSVAGLSSRRPLKEAWRTSLSAVQVANRTCATSLGFTGTMPRRASSGGLKKGFSV